MIVLFQTKRYDRMTEINKRLIYILINFLSIHGKSSLLENVKVMQVLRIICLAVALPGGTACGNLPWSSPEILLCNDRCVRLAIKLYV